MTVPSSHGLQDWQTYCTNAIRSSFGPT
ncbi:hypothetical protein PHBOTO_005215 [Pseudozyma hubeiensis]|nr:hypothetical protein PHBOTO_005215 [Pseudozyma hubeiensis]